MKITNEEIFQVKRESFDIGFSKSGYTLYCGPVKDVTKMTPWTKATPANEVCYVREANVGSYFCLVGNTDDSVFISW